MSRKRRDVTDDERALWRFVTRNVTPTPSSAITTRHPQPETRAEIDVPDKTESRPPQRPPQRLAAPTPRQSVSPQSRHRALVLGDSDGIDRRTAQRFARGEMAIDGRLDLHGLTVAQAQAAVQRFIRRAAADGLRCVILVTGKGRTAGDGESRGRIRAEALQWLGESSLRPLILTVREAQPQHGGSGALYVLLKRNRSG